MHDFALHNKRFAKGEVQSLEVQISETIDFQELALNAIRRLLSPKALDEGLGETIADEEELLVVRHSFKANRLIKEDSKDVFIYHGATTTRRDNVFIPRYLGQRPDDMEEDDEQIGSHELTAYYSLARNPETNEIDVDIGHNSIFYGEADEVLTIADSQEVEPIEAKYSRVIWTSGDADDDDAPDVRQYMSLDAQHRMRHEALQTDSAEVLSQVLLLPDTLHDAELYDYVMRQDLKIAVQSFRSLRALVREQAG